MCNACYYEGLDQLEEGEDNEDIDRSPATCVNPESSFRRSSLPDLSNFTMSQSTRSVSPAATPRAPRVLDSTAPLLAFDMHLNDEAAPALSARDWKMMKDFNAKLQKESVLTNCSRCKETWFNNDVKSTVCKKCRSRDIKKKDDEPFFYSDANLLDPGLLPLGLPKLSSIEEMLISRVHVMVEIRQHRGQQFHYSGHVCNFLRDVGKVYDKLPLFPKDLEIIILKPANPAGNIGLERQFTKTYKVRRAAVQMWLEFLLRHHSGYVSVVIDRVALAALPENGDVGDQIACHELPEVDQAYDQAAVDDILAGRDDDDAEVTAIPNLLAENAELDALQEAAGIAPLLQLTNPGFRTTPLSEFNRSQPLLSLAFPTLFPFGKAEFVQSRVREIKYADYIEHLLKYQDGRFAQHSRFRYVVFNTMMRLHVLKKSTYFVNKAKTDIALDKEALESAFVNPNDPQAKILLNSIVRYSASLRGTRPFWKGKRSNLETYIHSLGAPDNFVTASAADLHWDSLIQCYGPTIYRAWRAGTKIERFKITSSCLRDNPHIAAYHFHRRFLAMMEIMIKPKFDVIDWWNRYEFQQRASSHNHGFIWTKGGPIIIDLENPEQRQVYANYWGKCVSGILPKLIDWSMEERSMMSIPPEDDTNTLKQLSVLVNTLQRHICGTSYCMRVRKGASPDSEKFCRFWAPWAKQEEPSVDKEKNPQHYMFSPARNDERINGYVALLTMGWKANMDFTPCTSTHAVMNYLAKYCTKEEKKSTTYLDIVKQLLPYINSNKPLLSLVSKTMNKLIGERDWGAQEVMHILLNLPLQQGSREVITLDCRFQDKQVLEIADGEVTAKTIVSKLEKYLKRPAPVAAITFFQYLTKFNWKTFKERPRAKERLINYFPRYTLAKAPEDYARIKMLLHHPVQGDDIENLLQRLDEEPFPDWMSAFQYCSRHHLYHPTDGFGDDLAEIDEEENEFFEPFPAEPEENTLFWAEFAALRPGRDAAVFTDPDALGNRPIDLNFQWSAFVGRCNISPTWLKEQKLNDETTLEAAPASQSMIDSLALRQRQLFDIVVNQAIERHTYNNNPFGGSVVPRQLLYHVDGRAGTGKSFAIHCISSQIQQKVGFALLRAAPTGVAAHSIQGRTLHSLFRLPMTTGELPPLTTTNLTSLQATFRGVSALIIDEKSMLSLTTLAYLDQRLRSIFPRSSNPFGGVDVGIWGDFFQLPPVRARALYNNSLPKDLNINDVQGQALYQLFDKTVELDVLMRQQGQDPEQEQFRQTLEGMRNNAVTIEHWNLLASRVQSTLPAAIIATFDDALRLYGKKSDVNDYNHRKMRDLGVSVRQLKAQHIGGSDAEKASWDTGGNLHPNLPVCMGARVMLTENLWTERGLVNGALGTVRGLHWSDSDDISKVVPTILVQFDKYDGPTELYEGQKVVPVAPSRRDFAAGNVACTRIQVPLTIAWAITIHKAQGITAPKIVTNIAEKEHVVGLHYVAVSRVKAIKDIMFESPFDYSRFRTGSPSKTEVMRLADYARRLPQHLPDVIPTLD